MRTKLTHKLAGAAIMIGALASCNEELEIIATNSAEGEGQAFLDKVMPAYTDAFVNAFGEMDPNQDWGMDEEIGVIGAFSAPATRAGEVNTNRNMWSKFQQNGTKHEVTLPTYNGSSPTILVPDFDSDALGHDIQIPGFPHLNGLYYTANGNVAAETKTGDQITSGVLPAGDVTPYEIQYVSNWFRTHQISNPEDYRMKLHLTDFFIQNISWDNDQTAYNTAGIMPYQTGWEKTGFNGSNIENINDAKNHKAVNGGPYVKNNYLNENIQYFLDHLGFKDMDGNWTHVNNFNSGNSNFDPENKKSNPNRMIMYIKSAGTEDFRCHPSWCTETEWIYSWVLVRLTWTETVKDPNSPYSEGTAIPREGYYLAFDFHGEKAGQEVYQDGYYSNWIVKITPGNFNPAGNSKRIFCEDLGGSFDFDFNDAVVDVAFEKKSENQYIPIISVQAAGGTLPIYIEKNEAKYELHNLLGYKDDLTPINVKDKHHPVAIYRGDAVSASKPGLIKIYVKKDENTTYQISGNDDNRSVNDLENGSSTLDGIYNDGHESLVAPSAFAAPTSVKWSEELEPIQDSYSNFPNWVKNKNNNTDWYDQLATSPKLYDNTAVHHGAGIFAPPTNQTSSMDVQIEWRDLTPFNNEAALAEVKKAKADSYLRVQGYTGPENSVFSNLDGMTAEQRMTCTIVMSSSVLYNQATFTQNGDRVTTTPGIPLEAIVVPANINDNGTMSYGQATSFGTSNLNRFKTATYIEDQDEFTNEKAYTVEFSFKKSDLQKDSDHYYDYLLLFLRIGKDNQKDNYYSLDDVATYTISGDKITQSEIHGVKIHKWYVHY